MTRSDAATSRRGNRFRLGQALVGALVLVTLAACGSGNDSPASDSAGAPMAQASADQAGSGDADAPAEGADTGAGQSTISQAQLISDRQQILTADLVVESDSVLADARIAEAAVTTAGGVVTDERTESDPGAADSARQRMVSTLTIRVPPGAVNDLLTRLAGLGTLVSQSRGATDVTDEYVDIEARIASQQASLSRLLALVTDAGDLQDIVALENEISRRQSDLDALTARLQAFDAQVALATLTLTLTSQASGPVTAEAGFLPGLRSGWDAFTGAIVGGLTVFGAVLPFLLTIGLVGVPLYLLRRRRSAVTPAPVSQAPAA